jgi:hypothetical protein
MPVDLTYQHFFRWAETRTSFNAATTMAVFLFSADHLVATGSLVIAYRTECIADILLGSSCDNAPARCHCGLIGRSPAAGSPWFSFSSAWPRAS